MSVVPSGGPPSHGGAHTASPIHGQEVLFAPDERSRAAEGNSDGVRILIVEDDFLIAADLEAALADAGFNVIGIARSADEAIALAAAGAPALALMDIRLLGKRDGIDAALELFQVHGIRSVFASAHSDEHARRRAAPAQPLGWIAKPYSVATVVRFIARLAEGDQNNNS